MRHESISICLLTQTTSKKKTKRIVPMRLFIVSIFVGVSLFGCQKNNIQKNSVAQANKTNELHSDSIYFLETELDQFGEKIKTIKASFGTMDTTKCDSIFFSLLKFSNDSLLPAIGNLIPDSLIMNFGNSGGDTSSFDVKSKKILDLLMTQGITIIYEGEGTADLDMTSSFFVDLFKGHLSSELSDLLTLKHEENSIMYSNDGGIIISFEELGDRLARWQMFLTKHPASRYYAFVNNRFTSYLIDFMKGQDNTPVFRVFEDSTVEPEILKTYKKFLVKFKGTTAGNIISKYVDEIEKNNGKPSVFCDSLVPKLDSIFNYPYPFE